MKNNFLYLLDRFKVFRVIHYTRKMMIFPVFLQQRKITFYRRLCIHLFDVMFRMGNTVLGYSDMMKSLLASWHLIIGGKYCLLFSKKLIRKPPLVPCSYKALSFRPLCLQSPQAQNPNALFRLLLLRLLYCSLLQWDGERGGTRRSLPPDRRAPRTPMG